MEEQKIVQTEQEQKTIAVLASARLTESQVQTAIAESLLKNEELKDALTGKNLRVHTQWQTNKWSDPDALVHVFFTEDLKTVSDGEESGDTSGDSPEFSPESSPFFKEKESE